MISIDVPGHGLVAVELRQDEPRATYQVVERLSGARQALPGDGDRSVRVIVEVQRRFGGMTPRVVLGGEFTAQHHTETAVEVLAGASYDALVAAPASPVVPSRLSPDWPYLAGLPAEFAPVVLSVLTGDAAGATLPPGVLRVDRAAFDEVESSGPVFGQASAVLDRVISAVVRGLDVDDEVRRLVGAW